MDYKKRVESLQICLDIAKRNARTATTVEEKRHHFERVRDVREELNEVRKAHNA